MPQAFASAGTAPIRHKQPCFADEGPMTNKALAITNKMHQGKPHKCEK